MIGVVVNRLVGMCLKGDISVQKCNLNSIFPLITAPPPKKYLYPHVYYLHCKTALSLGYSMIYKVYLYSLGPNF